MADSVPLIDDDPTAPVFDPTTADLGSLLSQGQTLIAGLAPLNDAVTADQTAMVTAQTQLATDQAAQATATAAVQAAGHQLLAAVTSQFFLS